MKYIYICNAVPEKVSNYKNSSVAGNKFSINMAKALNNLSQNNVEVISLTQVDNNLIEKLKADEIWQGKKYAQIKKGRHFLISEFAQAFRVFCYIKKLIKNNEDNYRVIIENSPVGVSLCCTILKKVYKVPIYSITIDTPFTATLSKRGVWGKINCWKFRVGQRQLKNFNGIISFTKDICKQLKIDIPCFEFAIGCEEKDIPSDINTLRINEHYPRKIVYAGTLIYYNGIIEMLDAFAELGDGYQLHIYGYGPLEDEVIKMAKKSTNIIYHGRFNPDKTKDILTQADLLINPRILDPYIENFTFPSKLVDYVIAGKNVLSSKFKTLPKEYRNFLYLIDTVSKDTISNGIKFVFGEPKEQREHRIMEGIDYIRNHQTYDKVAENLIKFMEENVR